MMRVATRRVVTSKPRGFLPTDIAGLQLWLRADAGLYQDAAKTTPATTDGDVVGAWADQSGNGNDATQATTSKKPLLKTAIVNGKPIVRFDGTDDRLDGALGTLNAPFTIFVVAYFAQANQGANDWDYIYSLGNGLVADAHSSISRAAGNADTPLSPDVYYLYDGSGPLLGPFLSGQSWMMFSQVIRSNAVFHNLWLNGVSKTVTDNDNAINTNGSLGLGYYRSVPSHYLNGDIAEILVYDAALSNSARQRAEQYLADKYGITLS